MRKRELEMVEYYYEEGRRVNLWNFVVDPEDFFKDTQQASLKIIKPAMEMALESMRDEVVGAGWHCRDKERRDYRNGYYLRKRFETAIGTINGLRVPRCRKRRLVKDLRILMKQAQGALERKVVEMFLKGVSTRNVGELLDGLVGVSVSAGRVSALTRRLDAEVSRFHRRPLRDGYVYLFLDAIFLKSRNVPNLFRKMSDARRRVVLAAYGVTEEGEKELIDFRLEASENGAGWRRLLGSLWRRGLEGENLRVVITDGGKGVISAVEDFYPDVKHQRCWFHKMSNVLSKVRKRNQDACLKGLRKVYKARSRRAAERAYASWARRWKRTEEKAVRCVEKDLEVLLTFYDLPRPHWKMIRTTNAIERCFREVRRRTRTIGCFINNASIERIVYGLFRFMNGKRAGQICREFKAASLAA